jgi:hypothetical protein
MFFLQSMGEAKSTFGDRDVRSTADNLVMVSEIYSTVVNACFLNLSNRGSMTAIFSLSDCNFTSVACEDSRVFSVELYMLVYTRNFCCDFRCKFLLLMDVNEWMSHMRLYMLCIHNSPILVHMHQKKKIVPKISKIAAKIGE